MTQKRKMGQNDVMSSNIIFFLVKDEIIYLMQKNGLVYLIHTYIYKLRKSSLKEKLKIFTKSSTYL